MRLLGFLLAGVTLCIFCWTNPAGAELREVGERPAAVANRYDAQGVSPSWTLLAKRDLVGALRGGGFTITCRHGITDWSQSDRGVTVANSDERPLQRNLAEAGLGQAREINAAITALGIPIATVQASFFLRTREFAALAFAKPVAINSDLVGGGAEQRFRALLAVAPPQGANAALVSHQNTHLRAGLTSLNELEEGNCLIVKANGAGGFAILAHLAPRDWSELAREFR